jgi:hypothetical protein
VHRFPVNSALLVKEVMMIGTQRDDVGDVMPFHNRERFYVRELGSRELASGNGTGVSRFEKHLSPDVGGYVTARFLQVIC